MGIVRLNICCGPRLKAESNQFVKSYNALAEVIIPMTEHGFDRIPQIEIYAMQDGRNFIGEIQVNDQTFEVTIRQEDPIAFIIAMS